MIITCVGHAEFLLEMQNGMRLVTDPYDAECGYPVTVTEADAVLISHSHHDHSAVENVRGYTQLIDQEGWHTLAPDVTVTAVSAWHDQEQGAKRGGTLVFLVEAEGLRVVHLGDLGHLPAPEMIARLAPADVLMLPVGGYFTIDAKAARKTAELLRARVILPMHYRTSANPDWPIAPVEDFTALYPESETANLLRVTKEDLSCQPRVAVLCPRSLAEKR